MERAGFRPLCRAMAEGRPNPLVAIRKTALLRLQPSQDWVVNAALPAKEFLLQRGPYSPKARVSGRQTARPIPRHD
jgi:hypothetical protein